MTSQRSVLVAASGYETRIETFEGREHLVVPVVALVEAVLFAMNAPAPELVTAEEFSRAPGGWNGRPVFEGHPLKNGKPVSGNLPEVLEAGKIGIVFGTRVKGKKLLMEAWLDIVACEERAPELLRRAQAGETIEISVGVFVDKDDESGTFAGKKYKGKWKDIVPDHLALLPEGDEGACSVEAGCGVRAAKGASVSKNPFGAMFSRVLSAFRSAQPASEMSSRDLDQKLVQALREVEPRLDWIVTYLPVQNPDRVVYQTYCPGEAPNYMSSYQMFERAFTLGENGVVTLGDAVVEVEPVTYYEPVLMNEEVPTDAVGKRNSSKDQKTIQAMHDHAAALGATCAPTAAAAAAPIVEEIAAAAAASDNKETDSMELKDIVTFLGTASECDKKALRSALGVETPESVVAAAAPAAPTFAELLEAADPTVRAAINEGVRVASEKKAATIKALKDSGRCNFSDEQLGAFDQAQLDNLAALAQVAAPVVDFSAQAPRVTAEAQEVAAPPSLGDAITAARAKSNR